MANDVLAGLLHLNLAAAAAVLAVLALRPLARRPFGAELTYGLWACVPMAALATLVPAAAATRIVPPGVGPHFDPVYLASRTLAEAPAALLIGVWLVGAAAWPSAWRRASSGSSTWRARAWRGRRWPG
ncbi:M56 family metallopeptidase [Phenylobacterium sp.]|uniref:M56 family metallopeptidase n=1 Tax=Phenylobacterium sp. TaxID=1871053 RepID=UPI0012223811|nr:M56 family metallopeptidase [Phenylobacterium sp.]THD58664.1 MAG: hypothetical protein E8A49_19290 [Phenylobacterium sp.]